MSKRTLTAAFHHGVSAYQHGRARRTSYDDPAHAAKWFLGYDTAAEIGRNQREYQFSGRVRRYSSIDALEEGQRIHRAYEACLQQMEMLFGPGEWVKKEAPKPRFVEGAIDPPYGGAAMWTAAIDDTRSDQSSDGVWLSRIEVYGATEAEATELRDKVLAALQ